MNRCPSCGEDLEDWDDEAALNHTDYCEGGVEEPPPPKYHLCPQCQGHGVTVHAAVSVWTESDREEDPEGFEDMLAGHYDVTCPRCRGLRVVDTAREEEFTEEEDDRRTRLMESGIYPGSADYY